jgi:tetratricopeptide (TPR) repeat protein
MKSGGQAPEPPAAALVAQARRAYAARQLDVATALCERVLARDRGHTEANEVMGLVALERRELDAAMRRFETCASLAPDAPRYQYLIGRTHVEFGRCREAMPFLDRAIAAVPGSDLYVYNKVVALERLGEHDLARSLLEPLVRGHRVRAPRAALFARLEMHAGRFAEAIDFLRTHLDRADVEPAGRQNLLYALGKAYDRIGDYDAAFAAHREANEIDKPRFDRHAFAALFDRLISVFSSQRLVTLPRSSGASRVPVFVAGMPRSGTTLIEQVMAAHPDGFGAGELPHLDRLATAIAGEIGSARPYPACVLDLDVATADRLADAYVGALEALGGGAHRVVNKSLTNYQHAGLIRLLWPAAAIVFTRRSALDTAVSCYLNPMNARAHPWTKDLRDIGFVCRQHDRLLEHWREVIGDAALHVEYERLVAEPEAHVRRIIDFAGLPWDDRCLRFHESGRAVMTPSYDQVNRPVYDTSIGRWRRYEKHLGPLMAELESGPPMHSE